MPKGEKNSQWKGQNAGYQAHHWWVKKYIGQPTKCEHCGKDGLTGRKIHWANKSKKYLRKRIDWIRLCVPCHIKYDRNEKRVKIWTNNLRNAPSRLYPKKPKKCITCLKNFLPAKPKRIYCSNSCSSKGKWIKRKKLL